MDFLLWATSARTDEACRRNAAIHRRANLFSPILSWSQSFPAYPAQLRSLESSRPRPRTPLWNEIENAFGIYLSKANSGELTAEDAMNQANAEIKRIIERSK